MKLNLRQQSNWLFAQIAVIAAVLVIIFFSLLYKTAWFSVSLLGNAALEKAQAACGCHIASSSNFPAITGFILIIGIATAITFMVAVCKVLFTIIKTKKFIARQKINMAKPSAKLAQMANNIGIGDRVLEIHTTKPLIFCSGLRHPHIYISSAVVQSLTHPQLRAVLLHETHHMLSQEPARLLLIKFIGAFNFIPGIQKISNKYLSFSEMAADELATDNFTEKNHLATAMANVLEMEESNILRKQLALSYFSQITEERVLALSDNAYMPTFKKELLKTVAGVAFAAIVLWLCSLGIKAQQAQAQELHASSGCADALYVEKCDTVWGNCTNKVFHKKNITCTKSIWNTKIQQ